jgi:hypothetical protein
MLKALEARGALLHQVMSWNIARVKLAQAQGLLAEECGFVPRPVPIPHGP